MSGFVAELLTSATVAALLSAALIWLTKSWISERLKNAIKAEYDEKLETHKAQLKAQADVEIERLRSQLSIAATEHQVRFANLHEKRAEIIAELYGRLVQAYWDVSSFVSPMQWAGEPDQSQKYVTAMNSVTEFFRYFEKNKLYIPEAVCSQIETLVQEMRQKTIGFGVYMRYKDEALPPEALEKKHAAWTRAWEHMEKQVPIARQALEQELRAILGSV